VSGVDSTLRPVDREINCAISTANRRPRAATETGCRCAESRSRVVRAPKTHWRIALAAR
jgi:hypothetical protein